MENIKKGRSTNFNKEEELLLLQEIAKFKHIIECKTTNKVTNKEKEEVWQKILNAFNSKNLEVRSISQIKSKYDNLKTRTRKEVAKEKAYVRGTGGGPAIKKDLDPIIEATLDIINLKTVVGLPNMFDTDASNDFIPGNKSSQEEINEQKICDSEIVFVENIEATDLSDFSTQSPTILSCKKTIQHLNISQPDSAQFSTPSTSRLGEKRNRENEPLITEEVTIKKSDWSRYVPNNLKNKTNEKLRPRIKNPIHSAKETYYKTKEEILKKTFDSEENDRIRKREREEEEHEKKLILLDLEIKIKRQQLNDQ